MHSVSACVDAFRDSTRGIVGCYVRRSQAARSRRERDVRAQTGKGAASPNHTVYIGTVANLKYCALPTKITKMIVWI